MSGKIQVTDDPAVEFTPAVEGLIEDEVRKGRLLSIVEKDGTSRLYVPFGEGRAVPHTFTYEGVGPVAWSMTVQFPELGPTARPRCTRLILEAAGGGFIDAATLRAFPVGRFVEEAVLMTAIELDDQGMPAGAPIGDRAMSVKEARLLHKRIEREHRKRARGRRKLGRVDDERLQEVSRVYRAGVASGRPTKAVEEHFKPISRSTAGRWVQMARDRGFLGKAPSRGRAGEERDEQREAQG